MGQPSTLKYYKKLVYYVISLVVTMNNMVESKWVLWKDDQLVILLVWVRWRTISSINFSSFRMYSTSRWHVWTSTWKMCWWRISLFAIAMRLSIPRTLLFAHFVWFTVALDSATYLSLLAEQCSERHEGNILISISYLPSQYPDLQKYLLSLFFPENDHQSEAYHVQIQGSARKVARRMSQ